MQKIFSVLVDLYAVIVLFITFVLANVSLTHFLKCLICFTYMNYFFVKQRVK